MAQHSFMAAILGSDDARLGDMKAYFPKLSKLRASAPLVRERYPLLVTFDDINDPKSIKRVDPDDLVATFGPGYSLKSITLEITDEPVTTGELEKVLRWINELEKFRAHASNPFTSTLSRDIGGLRSK